MDQNEFLKQKHSFIHRHYWFFRHIIKAPSWQRYSLTLLIIAIIISSWFIYWYVPTQEQRLLHQQQGESHRQQTVLWQGLQQQQLLIEEQPTLSITDYITALITIAEQHQITITSYAPTLSHQQASETITYAALSLMIQTPDYASLIAFIDELAAKYPTIEILDMLIRKSEYGLLVTIQLQLITHAYKILLPSSVPIATCPIA